MRVTKRRLLKFYAFLLLIGCLTIINLFIYPSSSKRRAIKLYKLNAEDELAKKIWDSYRHEENLTCNIPHNDPFHPSILQYVEELKPINCEEGYPLLFKSTFDSTIVPVKTLEEYEKLGVMEPCCYQDITRDETSDKPDDSYVLSKACYPVSLSVKTKVRKDTEFIAIYCSTIKSNTLQFKFSIQLQLDENIMNWKTTGIVDIHAFVPVKSYVEKRIMDISDNKITNKNVDSLNVVVLGLDAVSHMNFVRVMPKTFEYLMRNLSAVEMNGFNKIGLNTFPNVAAVLTGLIHNDWTLSCELNETYDNCPMVWKKFAQNGYRTCYGEDSTQIGTFTTEKGGFRHVPTDYYLRHYGVAAETLIGHGHDRAYFNQCYGPRLQFNALLDYMQKMAYTMGQTKRYFQFLWAVSLTHDVLNDGKAGDQDLLLTLQWFHNNGYLDNTAFILMSDHGIRTGDILDVPQGQLELRLPFLFFVFPPWFRVKYKDAFENLQINRARLTTPFDLHETLNDLANLNELTSQSISQRQMELVASVEDDPVPMSISLFLAVPPTRTCSMARIEYHYCSCSTTTDMSVDNRDVEQATEFAVGYINSLMSRHEQCAVLALDKIKSARMSQFGSTEVNKTILYQVSFVVKPGGGSFDVSLFVGKEGWEVSGSIGRTNLYGSQSHCVDDRKLKLYCYCVDML